MLIRFQQTLDQALSSAQSVFARFLSIGFRAGVIFLVAFAVLQFGPMLWNKYLKDGTLSPVAVGPDAPARPILSDTRETKQPVPTITSTMGKSIWDLEEETYRGKASVDVARVEAEERAKAAGQQMTIYMQGKVTENQDIMATGRDGLRTANTYSAISGGLSELTCIAGLQHSCGRAAGTSQRIINQTVGMMDKMRESSVLESVEVRQKMFLHPDYGYPMTPSAYERLIQSRGR